MTSMTHNDGFSRQLVDDGEWYYAQSATITGDVRIGAASSVWYGAVIRADDAPVSIGRRVNLQDMTMVHPDPDEPLTIGDDVTIGHRAIVHCRSIGSGSLIGMGAILMAGVEVGAGSLIAAGSVVAPGVRVPPGSLVRGVPGRVVREVTEREAADIARSIVKYAETALSAFEQRGV